MAVMGGNWRASRLLCLAIAGLMAAGCASFPFLPEPNPPAQRHLRQSDSVNAHGAHVFAVCSEATQRIEAPEPDNLQDLIAVAVQNSPELRSAQARVDAAYGRMVQAGLCPNPAFGPHFS